MSFVSFKNTQDTPSKVTSASNVTNTTPALSMKVDVVPIPVSSNAVSITTKKSQNQAMREIKSLGKDLFQNNPTIMSLKAGKRLYQTADLYGQVMSVEEMIPLLTASDLTLKCSAIRNGTHAHNTVMELKTGVLADLLEETPDSKQEKMTELSIPNFEDNGRMFVGIKMSNGKHYIQKVDYEISAVKDDILHLNN